MTRLTRFLIGAALISAAAVIAAIHPQWGRSINLTLVFLLLAALVGAGILAFRSLAAEPRGAKHLSPTLATLSSAAILAIYAAGYHRTSAVAGGFAEESARNREPVQIAAAVAATASQFQVEPPASGSHAPIVAAPATTAPSQPKSRDAKNARSTASTVSPASAKPFVPAPVASTAVAPIAPPAPASAAPQIAMATGDPGLALTAPPAPAPPSKALYKDGTYLGWGSCRHGDIQASVTIQSGKIAQAAITQCLTRYSCSWIANLPGQVVQRQSPEVDYVSGASQSTDAFYGAIVSALSKAKN